MEMIKYFLKIKGIKEAKVLDSEQKEFIEQVELDEEKEKGIINTGVKQVLKCEEVYVLTHDNLFRDPQCEITKKKDGKTEILHTEFPEVPGAIISCPSWEVHEYLSAFIKVEKGDATLLVGINNQIT